MSDPLADVVRAVVFPRHPLPAWLPAEIAAGVRAHLAAVLDAEYRALEDKANSAPDEERWDRLSRQMSTVREVKDLLLSGDPVAQTPNPCRCGHDGNVHPDPHQECERCPCEGFRR